MVLPGSAGGLQDPLPTKAGISPQVVVKYTDSPTFSSKAWSDSGVEKMALGPGWMGSGKGKSRQHWASPSPYLHLSLSPQRHQPTARGAPAAPSSGPGPPAVPRKGAAHRPRSVSPRPLQPCRRSSCPAWPCLRRPQPPRRRSHHPSHLSRCMWHPRPPAHHLLHCHHPRPRPQTPPWTSCGLSRRLPTPSGSWLAPCSRDWPN